MLMGSVGFFPCRYRRKKVRVTYTAEKKDATIPTDRVTAKPRTGTWHPPGGQLLADPLEDQHVRVHGHPHRQDQAGDPRQREGGIERRQPAQNEDHVDRERT